MIILSRFYEEKVHFQAILILFSPIFSRTAHSSLWAQICFYLSEKIKGNPTLAGSTCTSEHPTTSLQAPGKCIPPPAPRAPGWLMQTPQKFSKAAAALQAEAHYLHTRVQGDSAASGSSSLCRQQCSLLSKWDTSLHAEF